MSALRTRVMLREAIREILIEKDLSASELTKHGGYRFDAFLEKLQKGEPFTLSKKLGGTAVIKSTPAIVKALKAHDGKGLEAALRAAVWVDQNGNQSTGIALSNLEKTPDLGGKLATKETKASQNEQAVSNAINGVVAMSGKPVTVVFGDRKFENIVSADHTGEAHQKGGEGQSTSKPDIIMHDDNGGEVRISIKMEKAEYYLSGDKQMAPILAPVLGALEDADPPDPRLKKKKGEDEWEIVVGPKAKPAKKNVKFPVSPETAEKAVFNSGTNNSVDIIVRGDLTKHSFVNDVLTWPNVKVEDSLADLPDDEKPVGLLRHGAGRYARDTTGRVYKGIRPAVVTKKRAAAAVEVPISAAAE